MPTFHKILVFLLFISLFPTYGQTEFVHQTKTPNWIEYTQPKYNLDLPKDKSAGYDYLLVDNQDHLAKEEFYFHFAYRINNIDGVQNMSDIMIDFDPEYQRINFHEIKIIRDGKSINKLDLSKIKTIQRESDMERHLYDGSLTLIANLTDVRVGDIIEYSYTRIGDNPVHGGIYENYLYLQHNIPVHHIKYAVYVPSNEKINFKNHNYNKKPIIENKSNFTKYVWEEKDLEQIIYENNVPAWYDPASAVEISQFKNWGEVVEQYGQFFKLKKNGQDVIKQKAISLQESENERKFINNAIRFVQDDIRYLGFENGVNSHKPSSPVDVINKRYGDCKDKSFLLVELLKAQGVDAYPVLVHSSLGKNLNKRLPSSGAFNHCVVQIDLGNQNYKYVDPTINGQGGGIENLYFPDYGYGLVLKPETKGLTLLPNSKNSKTEISEIFELDSVGGGAIFNVETIYTGGEADIRRREFNGNSIESIQKDYLNFYSGMYPTIKSTDELSFIDDRETNKFTVKENYKIEKLWTSSPENEKLIFSEFYPLSFEPHLFPAQSAERTMPYYINPEAHVVHKTIVYVPEKWPVENDMQKFEGASFKYNYDVKYGNAKLEITHEYKNLNDHVAPEAFSDYFTTHTKAQENLSNFLSYDTNYLQTGDAASTSWLTILLIIFVIALGIWFCRRIYLRYDLPTNVQKRNTRSIGGWLILIGLGISITPIIVIAGFLSNPDFFSPLVWDLLFDNNNFLLGLLILFEVVYNSTYIVFSIFVIILFFQKRSIAPRMIIIMFVATFLATTFDTMASIQLNPNGFTGAEEQDMYMEIFKLLIKNIIWVPYLIYSQRVKETFTKTLKTEAEPEAIEHSTAYPLA